MFDFLRTVSPKDLDCRMIHIAASPPDSSKHPQWNSSPSLDSLTWELLPAELKKVSNRVLSPGLSLIDVQRNIQLSGINIFPGLPRFPELYTQVWLAPHYVAWCIEIMQVRHRKSDPTLVQCKGTRPYISQWFRIYSATAQG